MILSVPNYFVYNQLFASFSLGLVFTRHKAEIGKWVFFKMSLVFAQSYSYAYVNAYAAHLLHPVVRPIAQLLVPILLSSVNSALDTKHV